MIATAKDATMTDSIEEGGVGPLEARPHDEKQIKETVSVMKTEAENFIAAFRKKYRREE